MNAEVVYTQRGLLNKNPNRPTPAKVKLMAVVGCMGGSFGEIRTMNPEWMAHPISTIGPSRMARALDNALIRFGHDTPRPGPDINPTHCYRPMQNNALAIRFRPEARDQAISPVLLRFPWCIQAIVRNLWIGRSPLLPASSETGMIGAMAPGSKMIFGAGDRIGDYEVLAPLGAGGMGSVYKVRHAISQRVEALKVVLPSSSATAEMAERFLREIRLQASLEHPHIASLHNAFRIHDELVMVMEFVEGVSLRDKMRLSGITLGQALEYAAQVLGALAYAHAHGVVHRDVKPSNVMIASHGVVKLLDFGLAVSSTTDPGARGPDAELTLTQPGTLLGSPYYISPEQARGERADARSDVYSTGAMLYEMVAGRPPFDGAGAGGAYAIIAAHLHQTPRSPAEVRQQVPQELARIILKALAKNPADRFSSAGDFLAALNAIRLDANRLNETATVGAVEPAAADASVHSAADLERLSKELATFIGPIAHILVRRAAPESPSLSALYQTLAQEISSVSKREQFLASMPKPLSRSASGTPSGGSRTSG